MSLHQIWHPEIFQGVGKRRNYFEGWYFKLTDRANTNALGIIPGISLGDTKEDSHAFIQVIDATKGHTFYIRYPLSAFQADHKEFSVKIGKSAFKADQLTMHIEDEETRMTGELYFDEIVKFPSTILSPGIMGPFSFMPLMECRHGIINMNHKTHGRLMVNGREIDFEGGEGYIEKDWGKSFPSAWIWVQANHFDHKSTSFMFSFADIPFMGRHFKGLIAYLQHNGRFFRFATYNGCKVQSLMLEEDSMSAVLSGPFGKLIFSVERSNAYLLKAPKRGKMERVIEESIDAEVKLQLQDRKGNALFSGTSRNCGLEISENAMQLL